MSMIELAMDRHDRSLLTLMASGFVLFKVTNFLISFTTALPVTNRQSNPETSPETNDRSSTWQVLADGTQDLAALIGLFATDSVERYAVDYSRGYFGAALAPCSMFGILGYVRALVKLALGTEACVAAAFPTAPVRSILGVPPQDRLPGDELVTVNYVRRTQSGDNVTWQLIKSVAHTKESMPVTWAHTAIAQSSRIPPALFLLDAWRQGKLYFSRQKPPHRWHVAVAIVASTGVNCLLVLAIGTEWPWFKLVASVGMFAALCGSSLMWASVYIAEQVPIFDDPGPVFLDQEGEVQRRPCGSVSLRTTKQDEQLVFIERAGSYILLPCKTLSKRAYMACRISSGILAVIITLGYLCQYIVIRSATETQSLTWLLVQGALTLFRVSVWVFPSQWVPRIFDQKDAIYSHLKRPAFSDFQSASGNLVGSGIDSYKSFQELELATAFSSSGVGLDEISIPSDVLGALQRVKVSSTFEKPLGPLPSYVDEVVHALGQKHPSWNMHPLLFRKLLLQRINDPVLETLERSNDLISGDYTCKLLDIAGKGNWEESRPELVPLIRVSFQLEALDSDGRCVNRRPESGWCTFIGRNNPRINLVEVSLTLDSYETTWVPLNLKLPTPEGFCLGEATTYRVVLKRGQADDLTSSSFSNGEGYLNLLERLVQHQRAVSTGSPQRWYIRFHEDSVLLVEDVHPEVLNPSSVQG
ncbi:hypothetical protein V8F20_006925 [Naviculisporaceae sp. PSN 640]